MKIWIGNLGKYNEGILKGGWLDLPTAKENIDKFLRETVGLQLTQKEVDEALAKDGVCYEEWMINDIETDLECYDYFEYESPYKLNLLAAFEEKANNIELINAYCEEHSISDIEGICNVILQEQYIDYFHTSYDSFLSDYELMAYAYIENVYYDNIPEDLVESNFDYEVLGRDLNIEYSQYDDDMPETAGEYYCGDENATDREIGEAYVEDVGFDGISEPENYFDYEQFGRELDIDGFSVVKNDYGDQIVLFPNSDVNEGCYSLDELKEEVSEYIEPNEEIEVNINSSEHDITDNY